MSWILAGILCILLVEGVSRLPIVQAASTASDAARRAVRTMSAPKISDHWKEKVLLVYAGRIFGATLRLVAMLVLVAGLALGAIYLLDALAPGFADFMMGWAGLIFTLVFATLYYLIRKPGQGRAAASAYGPTERMLHRLALGSPAMAEILFDMSVASAKPDTDRVAQGAHVFVAGLARAGTTILMRRFYASGAFCSLTYRDMPFVIAPGLWSRISGLFRRDIAAHERAHGDGIIVDADSPESFDEAFWRLFDGKAYIHEHTLVPHAPSDETLEAYRKYVGVVLTAGGKERYLCKNNNNVLRLEALGRAFPNALILVPFREPVSHAASLRAQHQRFLESQAKDPFETEYMGYLGHHEFGSDHRPFRVTETPAAPGATPESLDYWLGLWIDVHEHVLAHLPTTARLVCYEALCADPHVWQTLADAAGLETTEETTDPFRLSRHDADPEATPDLQRRAEALYAEMTRRAATGPEARPQSQEPV